MAGLNPLVDLTGTVTRQHLFDAWSTAVVTTLSETDLAPELHPIIASASAPSEPPPGQLWADTNRKLLYCWHDEHEGTAVSLWLAIGPDRLETPCIAAGPIGPGCFVEAWYDRWVKVSTVSEGALGDGVARIIGTNTQNVPYPLHVGPAATAPSGSWISVAIEGFAPALTPVISSADSLASVEAGLPVTIDPNNPGAVRSAGFWTQRRGNPVVGEALYDWPPSTQAAPSLVMIKLFNGPRRTVL
jgi:hypothetical protein